MSSMTPGIIKYHGHTVKYLFGTFLLAEYIYWKKVWRGQMKWNVLAGIFILPG